MYVDVGSAAGDHHKMREACSNSLHFKRKREGSASAGAADALVVNSSGMCGKKQRQGVTSSRAWGQNPMTPLYNPHPKKTDQQFNLIKKRQSGDCNCFSVHFRIFSPKTQIENSTFSSGESSIKVQTHTHRQQ